jgi:hypothetical protein
MQDLIDQIRRVTGGTTTDTVLPDGGRLQVPITLMDSASVRRATVEDAVAADAARSAWEKGGHDLNAWRNRSTARDGEEPAPRPTHDAAASEEAAWLRAGADLNAWRKA